MRVLTVGTGSEKLAKELWPESTLKIATSLQFPKGWGGQYDIVLAYRALQRVPNAAVNKTLKNWYHVLKPGGELHLFVPSLEWASREILNENPSPMTFITIFGTQMNEETFWLSGYTMRRLRVDMEDVGFKVEVAKVGYHSEIINEQEFQAEQHYVVGRKPDAQMP